MLAEKARFCCDNSMVPKIITPANSNKKNKDCMIEDRVLRDSTIFDNIQALILTA
jgi:hypothetical protein